MKILQYEINCVNESQYIDVLSTLPLFITDNYFDIIKDDILN